MKNIVLVLIIVGTTPTITMASKIMTWDANTRGEACTNAKKILEIRGKQSKSDCQCTQKNNGTWTCAAESTN